MSYNKQIEFKSMYFHYLLNFFLYTISMIVYDLFTTKIILLGFQKRFIIQK